MPIVIIDADLQNVTRSNFPILIVLCN